MSIQDFFSVLSDVPVLLKLKKGLKPRPSDETDCFAKLVEANAVRFADRTAIRFEEANVSWDDLNKKANQYAHALKSAGVQSGHVVSLMMENRVELVAIIVALNKLGAVTGLINTNLRENPLRHCITVTESSLCVFGSELTEAIAGVRDQVHLEDGSGYFAVADGENSDIPDWARDLDEASHNLPDTNLDDVNDVTLGSTAMYIFTSGTTGLPKAALVSNRRYLAIAVLSHTAGLRCDENDSIYCCLPLYHGTGLMIGVGAAFSSGATLLVRRRFSVSQFLPEVRELGATCFIYVGELCRYLNNSPRQDTDSDNPLHSIMGNGLRPDIWHDFKERFGIGRVTEFYGASEGNVAFANILNKDLTVGMTASKVALVQYDVDNDEIVRDNSGRCLLVEPGESGLCLGHINPNAQFEGYTDKDATDKKILRDVLEDGDQWFNTGDLMRTVDVGFSLGYDHYQFVDRVGDTFRWRSENVSTNEVGEAINGVEGVEICNVYGVTVPGAEGRAGMVSIALQSGVDSLDMDAFADHIRKELPPFARPVFVRIQRELDLTGTFKMVKRDLVQDGFDVTKISDPVYVMKPGSSDYVTLDSEYLAVINDQQAGF